MNAVESSPEAIIAKIIGSGKPKRLDLPVPPELLELQAAQEKKGQ